MDYFVDIKVRPEKDFPVEELLSALFANLHSVLINQKKTTIGVSFPELNLCKHSGISHLGTVLRIHGSFKDISNLMVKNWLSGMRDYSTVSPLARVPEGAMYRIVRRFRTENLSNSTHHKKNHTHKPSIWLRSLSNGQDFRLFIEHKPIQSEPATGEFSSYGLSKNATVPWF